MQSTLAKLSLCRTAALGGRRYRCETCESECTVYNSCGDRHCPQCSGAKRTDWLTSTSELLLPGVRYFQVVFTIPDKLSSLALGNRRVMYDLLFQSAWRSLSEVIGEEQGYEAAATMVLHTWNQKLEPHAHVHAVVPGGGPSLDGKDRWLTSRRPGVRRCNGKYLVDADELRLRFRKTFLSGLSRLYANGKLKLEGEWAHLRDSSAFAAWVAPLEAITWVAYIEPPPTEQSSPEHVLKYLARYLTGGPISDRRLISHTHGRVTFWARTGTKTGGDGAAAAPYTLSGTEFVRRWSLHILPKSYVKTRRFGGYSNHHCERYLAECRRLLQAAGILPTAEERPLDRQESVVSAEEEEARLFENAGLLGDPTTPCCAGCGAVLVCIATDARASWFSVMHSPQRPSWYNDG